MRMADSHRSFEFALGKKKASASDNRSFAVEPYHAAIQLP